MRFVTIILSLFLCITSTYAFCNNHKILIDTLKKHTKSYSSLPHSKRTIPKDKLYYNDCLLTNKYTIAQRLKKYPFVRAWKILAVSYDGTSEPNLLVLANGDTINAATNEKVINFRPHGLFFKNDTLDYKYLFETKQLTKSQINRLTNILFNTDVKIHNDYADPGYKCFEPRNALIFLDENGKVFDYIEICFTCEGTRSKSDRVYLGPCNQKYDMVKKFFIDLGIKYGTITKEYPKQ
jgi:hypothetical protein